MMPVIIIGLNLVSYQMLIMQELIS